MKKIFNSIYDNILFVLTLFLLAFIPLYPKLPLLDIVNTWVYIRLEDLVVVLVLALWTTLLLRKKITLNTPLTMPIIIFWIIGGIATIHGVLLIFPGLANVFPNVAFLSFLRRIEYLSLFFVAYIGIKDKRALLYVIAVLVLTLIFVIGYGIGQKYLGFPAYLTMNEEFAKGIPIQLSPLSRVPSTFGGHYDLAAYLVLVIPILTSLVFGFRNYLLKLALLICATSGFVLLFMTVSRVSFFVLLVSLVLVLFFQKRRLVFFSVPVLVLVLIIFFSLQPSLLGRFGSTIKEVDVLVDASSGEAIGHVETVPLKYFEDKIIIQKFVRNKLELDAAISGKEEDSLFASPSAIIPFSKLALPPQVIVVKTNAPTGENLPQGTGYINLTLAPVAKRIGEFFYEKPKQKGAFILHGDFLVKRAAAYDLSFTTRFQGEWPRAIAAFKRNILFGSGYGSISLAVDNNYLRILGEVGSLGFASFFAIFITAGIYIRRVLPNVSSPVVRSFVLGFIAGVVGLVLNAILIDVFEASKIAFLLWLLTGVVLGVLHFYQTKSINLFKEFKKVITSSYAVIVYLLITIILIFSPMLSNFFVGDDFTWFRWATDCSNASGCTIFHYFTQSDGFFYRPGAKIFFLLMYKLFWLNQAIYHMVSIFLHFIVTVLIFLITKKILRSSFFSALSSFLFLILSGFSEAVFWISATGFLFTAVFSLLSLLFFILWKEKRKTTYFIFSLLALIFGMLFHELGVVTPLFLILYKATTDKTFTPISIFKKLHYKLAFATLFAPLLPYLILRFLAGSHWFSGDYSYNLLKLPYNIVGNTLGFLSLALFGPTSLPIYQALRNFSREHILIAILASLVALFIIIFAYRRIVARMEPKDRRIVMPVILFAIGFFLISLLPFLGLGNIASRYSYLASLGFIILFVFIIKKLYDFLQSQGHNIALAATCSVITLFCLLHIIQIQQIHSDWYEAGAKTKRFFIAIDEVFADYWTTEPMKFYFVNVPIRHGEAWVFSVGLEDALWLSFRNPNIKIYKAQSVEQALNEVSGQKNERVFEFDKSGKLIEHKKILATQ